MFIQAQTPRSASRSKNQNVAPVPSSKPEEKSPPKKKEFRKSGSTQNIFMPTINKTELKNRYGKIEDRLYSQASV